MKKIGMLFALLAGALLAAQAQAQAPGQTYFGFGGGITYSEGSVPLAGSGTERDTAGGKIYFGSIGDRYGWEVGGYHLGVYDVTATGTTTKLAESLAYAATFSGVLAADLGGGYVMHAKLGLAFTQHVVDCTGGGCGYNKSTTNGTSGIWGVGVGTRLGHNMEARIDYEHIGSVHHGAGTTEYSASYDLLWLSLQFGF